MLKIKHSLLPYYFVRTLRFPCARLWLSISEYYMTKTVCLTGDDCRFLVHIHVGFGHANGPDERVVHRRPVEPHDCYVVSVRGGIVVRVRSDVRRPVVDVLRVVGGGEVVFAQPDDKLLFGVAEKRERFTEHNLFTNYLSCNV